MKVWSSVVMPFRAIRATKPDFVHTRIGFAAWGLTTLFRVPTILELHEDPAQKHLLAWIVQSATHRRSLRGVVTITEALANRVRPLLPNAVKMVVTPDGVDASLIALKTSKDEARKSIGLGTETRRLAIYTGQLYNGRGIELIAELAHDFQDHLFLVVGGREADIAKWRRLSTNASNLRFVGFVSPNHVFDYLLASDVLLMPYAQKVEHGSGGNTAAICSPMKMFEYLAAGRPIIASDLPVLQEVLRDESNCLIAPYEQPATWAQALQRLGDEPALAKQLGEQAKNDAVKYTWERRAERIAELAKEAR